MPAPERMTSSRSDAETTRREALRRVGGGMALAALASAALGGRVVAQSATPDASAGFEGSYSVLRLRKVKEDKSAEELVALVHKEFVPLVETVPGFVSYFIVYNPDTRDWVAVGIFADKAGADESTARAAEWGQGGASDYVEGDPTVVEGGVVVAVQEEQVEA